MNGQKVKAVALGALVLLFTLGAVRQAQAADEKTQYPSMPPLDQYLMDRTAEIALARSAAPPSISRDATVMILGKNGYETAVEGKNGFVCAVERGWMNPFDSPEFWSPKTEARSASIPPPRELCCQSP